MAKRFGLWQRLARSPYDEAAYRDVATDSLGRLFGYLLVLILLWATGTTLITQVRLRQGLEALKPLVREHFPPIQIRGGKLSSPVPQPYRWGENDVAFILDTTGATTDLSPEAPTGVLVTQTEIIMRQDRFETRRYSLAEVPDMDLDAEIVNRLIGAVQSWAWVVVGVAGFLWGWIIWPLSVLPCSLLSVLTAVIAKRSLSYGAIYRLGIYALTVPLTFGLIVDAIGLQGLATSLGWWLLYGGYLVMGVLAQSPEGALADDAPPAAGG